ncbi:MAG: acylphosphatase [Betaproteobacteria bacterium]
MMTRQIRVAGGVQGVGYRYALVRQAQRAGLTGWVRNRSDGTVEAVLQGPAQAVEAVVEWARRGPPAARVSAVKAEAPEAQFDRPYAGFEQWPTL